VDVEFFVVKEKGRELLLGACLERRNWRERGERSVETHHFARQCAWKRNALSSRSCAPCDELTVPGLNKSEHSLVQISWPLYPTEKSLASSISYLEAVTREMNASHAIPYLPSHRNTSWMALSSG
jgi:hypothetical protein